jgi:hypothetical protein
MHETHALPALLSIADLLSQSPVASSVASRRALASLALAYSLQYTVLMHWLANTRGVWVYPFLARLSDGMRALFCAASMVTLGGLVLLSRAALLLRSPIAERRGWSAHAD